MKNKDVQKILKPVIGRNKVSLNGRGERLFAFFQSNEQFEVIEDTAHLSDFHDAKPYRRDRLQVLINGEYHSFSERTANLKHKPFFRDSKLIGITTENNIKRNI